MSQAAADEDTTLNPTFEERLEVENVARARPNCQMYVSVCVAMVGAMMFGLDQGNFGNVQGFPDFREMWCYGRFGDETTCSPEKIIENKEWNDGFVLWGATLITFGAAAGTLLLAPFLARRFGRRPCIGVGSSVCVFGCLMASYLCMGSVTIFYIGRFVTGFGVGVSCFVLPVYNAEISTPSIRGACGSIFQLNVAVGVFLATMVTKFCENWEFGMLLPGVAGAVLMVATPFLPESPRFIFETKGFEAGVRELQRIRVGKVSAEAQEIMNEIRAESGVTQVSYIGLFKNRNLRKRVLIACTLVLGQQASGVNAFLGYAGTIFTKAGITDYLTFNCMFNCIMILGCIAGLLLVDSPYGGRRCQLLFAAGIMGPPLMIAAATLQFDLPSWILMFCLILYGVGFQFAWGTIPWIYPAEIFNMAEKERAVSLAVGLNYLANAVVVMITPPMMEYGTTGTFYFFGVLNLANFVFVFLYVVETKGIPLEEIPPLFKGSPLSAGSDTSSSDSESSSSGDSS